MTKKHTQTCPIAGFLNLFGDAWSLLIIREAFYGATRFSEFLQNTGVAKNILTDRLGMLVDAGLLERVNIGERGVRYAYRLTERGKSLMPVMITINQWVNEQVSGEGRESVDFFERASGQRLRKLLPRDREGRVLEADEIVVRAGPGASRAARARISTIPGN